MKVLFIYSNVNGFHENCYSPGLAYIVSITRKSGFESKVLIVRNKNDYLRVKNLVRTYRPRIIGFTAVSSQFSTITELARLVKNVDERIITVCGGVHPTIYPECLLEEDSLDGVFIGESEHAFVEFLQRIDASLPYESTDNFAYVKNGKIIRNPLKPLITNLDELPYPDKKIYPYKEAIAAAGYAPFVFSRGCPYLCTYCCNHAIANRYGLSKNKMRCRSVESSIREIEEALTIVEMNRIVIRDDIFGLDRGWMKEFCQSYKKRINQPFSVFSRADIIDDEYAQLLKEAGCSTIAIAIESGNDYIRNNVMNKNISKNQIKRSFEISRKHGLETTGINLIGVPNETEEMIWETILFNRSINPTNSRANIFHPYKGTKLGDYCFTKGLVDISLINNFTNERRESVLTFPQEHRNKLIYYQKNWQNCVYGNWDYPRFNDEFRKEFNHDNQ